MASGSNRGSRFSSRGAYILSLVPRQNADSGDEEEDKEEEIRNVFCDNEIIQQTAEFLDVFVEERLDPEEAASEVVPDEPMAVTSQTNLNLLNYIIL